MAASRTTDVEIPPRMPTYGSAQLRLFHQLKVVILNHTDSPGVVLVADVRPQRGGLAEVDAVLKGYRKITAEQIYPAAAGG